MKKTVFVVLLFIGICAIAYGQTKNDDILRLIRISGTSEIMVQTIDVMIPQFQQLVPDVPKIFWDRFRENLNIEYIINALVPVYDRHFTHDEIVSLIAFYESPTGRRLVEVTPAINLESMAIGQRWGEQLGQDIVDALIKEGYLDL